MSEELTPQARALLAASDPSLELPPDVRDRVRGRLAASLATDGAAAAGAADGSARTRRPARRKEAAAVAATQTGRGRTWAIGAVLAAAALLLLWQGPRVLQTLDRDDNPSAASHVRDEARAGGEARQAGEGEAPRSVEQARGGADDRHPSPGDAGSIDDAASDPGGEERGAAADHDAAAGESATGEGTPVESAADSEAAATKAAAGDRRRGSKRPAARDDASGGGAASEEPAPVAPSKSAVLSITEELRSLEAIQATLRAGKASAALKEIETHRRRFPKRSMAQELKALEIIARCKAGQHARGRRDAAAFLDAHPGSALASRVAAACPEEAP